jgi:hypothetical protein
MRRLICTLLLALATLPTRAAEDIRVSETRTVTGGDAASATDRLTVHFYFFRGSQWEPDEVARAIPAVSALLRQCDIAIAHAALHIVDAPSRFRLYSTPVSRELLRALAVSKPAIFLVDETLNRPAYDAETIGLGNSRSRPELAHTIWVAYGARDLPYALAHELVHLLSNSGEHSGEAGNLMRDETSPQNATLTSTQCELARERGESQGLLVRR